MIIPLETLAIDSQNSSKLQEEILFSVYTSKEKKIITNKGKEISTPKFDWVGGFSEDLATISIDGKCGFINKKGKIVIEPQFDDAMPFKDGLAKVKINNKWKIINKLGQVIFFSKEEYKSISALNSEIAIVETLDDTFGFINKNGDYVLKPEYQFIGNENEGLFLVQKQDKWGFVDKTGKIIIKPELEWAQDFHEGLAGFSKNAKWGFMDKALKTLIKPKFTYVENFSEGLAGICIKDKWGFIDKKGKIIIKPKYKKIEKFENGKAKVEFSDTEYGYINRKGKLIGVLKLNYGKYCYNDEDLTKKIINGKEVIIDEEGKPHIKKGFYDVGCFHEDLARVLVKGYWGFIDKKGKFVITPKYDNTSIPFNNGRAIVEDGTYRKIINKSGKVIKKSQSYLSFPEFSETRAALC